MSKDPDPTAPSQPDPFGDFTRMLAQVKVPGSLDIRRLMQLSCTAAP
jgi:hypothetical protein